MKAYILFGADILLKLWAKSQTQDTWHGIFYPCQNIKPISIWTLLSITTFVWLTIKSKSKFWIIVLWCGILSNTFERIAFGTVTDMIPLPVESLFPILKTPILNLADVGILISSLVLLSRLR